MATAAKAAATTTTTTTTSHASAGGLTEDEVVSQLGELRAILTSLDKIVATARRLQSTLSPGGELFESQRDLTEVVFCLTLDPF